MHGRPLAEQNNNEALNQLVWNIGPKELFAGPETVLTACAIAVCMGVLEKQTLLRGLDLVVGEHCKCGLTAIEKQRQQNNSAKFVAVSEKGAMKGMRSRKGQHMSFWTLIFHFEHYLDTFFY